MSTVCWGIVKVSNIFGLVVCSNILQVRWCTYRIFLQITWWKNFENWSTFPKIIIKHQVASFFETQCILLVYLWLYSTSAVIHFTVVLARRFYQQTNYLSCIGSSFSQLIVWHFGSNLLIFLGVMEGNKSEWFFCEHTVCSEYCVS